MISPRLHALLDGLSVAGLALGPTLRNWPRELRGPLFAAGAGVAAYSLATRYRAESEGALSLDQHRALDAAQGLGFLVAGLTLRALPEVRLSLAGYGAFSLAAAALTRAPAAERPMRQIPLPSVAVIRPRGADRAQPVAPGVSYLRLGIVNVGFIGPEGAGDRRWVLVDAGLRGTAERIMEAAAEHFGPGARPAAILMTHGHFDHVGALEELAQRWDAPVYAHPLELPYLNGTRSYPSGDPSVGGGLMAALAPLYPTAPVDVGDRLQPLPSDGTVPGAAGWRWLHTPGHSPGHVSFWRDADRCVLSGDAVITTRQESAYSVAIQRAEMHGPPAYFTPDWHAAGASVRTLSGLAPEVLLSGHGRPARGRGMTAALHRLAVEFDEVAVPRSEGVSGDR